MCLRVDGDGFGDAKGTHLSVFLYLMKGPHDNELTWPLRGNFKIKLLNQISDREHHAMTVSYDDHVLDKYTAKVRKGEKATCGWGIAKFISNEDLHMTTLTYQYLKDDCLFLQVTKL